MFRLCWERGNCARKEYAKQYSKEINWMIDLRENTQKIVVWSWLCKSIASRIKTNAERKLERAYLLTVECFGRFSGGRRSIFLLLTETTQWKNLLQRKHTWIWLPFEVSTKQIGRRSIGREAPDDKTDDNTIAWLYLKETVDICWQICNVDRLDRVKHRNRVLEPKLSIENLLRSTSYLKLMSLLEAIFLFVSQF